MPIQKRSDRAGRRGGRVETRTGRSANSWGSGSRSREIKMGINLPTTIDFVVDYSRSIRDILPTIYIFCCDLMNACQLGTGKIRFGITYFSDEVTKKTWKGEDFTEFPTDIQDAMLTREIGGGSRNGRENIGQALHYSLEKLRPVPAGERVIILFTDAQPQDLEKTNCREEIPVRSAVLFVPTEYSGWEYVFQMVDGQGHPLRSKTPFVFDIREVITERYLKTVEVEDKEERLIDNAATRNQLLLALS